MFFRPIRDKIKSLRRMIGKIGRTRGAAPADLAELQRLMLSRIAELEARERADSDPSSASSQNDRRAA